MRYGPRQPLNRGSNKLVPTTYWNISFSPRRDSVPDARHSGGDDAQQGRVILTVCQAFPLHVLLLVAHNTWLKSGVSPPCFDANPVQRGGIIEHHSWICLPTSTNDKALI